MLIIFSTLADLIGTNFVPQGNQIVPNSPSVQMMPSPQASGQPVNNPNMPIQVKINVIEFIYLFFDC